MPPVAAAVAVAVVLRPVVVVRRPAVAVAAA
jgi:hypothetical protein